MKGDIRAVYKIANKVTGEYYIGSSTQAYKRLSQHKTDLKNKEHHCLRLQLAYNESGKRRFEFSIVESGLSNAELERIEGRLINKGFKECLIYNTNNNVKANRGKDHPLYGKHHSEKSKKLIKDARAKQTIKHSKATRAKIGAGNKGRISSPDTIEQIRQTKLKRYASGEIVTWNKGKTKHDDPRIGNKYKRRFHRKTKEKILSLYANGHSIEFIRCKFKVDWLVIKELLIENNIQTRNISQQGILRYAKQRENSN